MKYTYIRLKYIIPTLLIIALLTVLGVYFIGGLKASSISFDNLEWNSDGFANFNGIDEAQINKVKVVGHNKKYVMVIDEGTTIISVYEKKTGWNVNNPTDSRTTKLLYSSAQSSGDNEAKSNIVLEYYNENGKTSTISSFAKSVQYENVTTGGKERYYQIRYGEDQSYNYYVDILYSIGDFSPIVIPDKFDMYDFEEMFVGNTVFRMQRESDIKDFVTIYDEFGNPTEEKGVEWKHQNGLYCFDNEAALYILENGFGVLEFKPNDTFTTGKKYTNKDVTDEQRQEILNAKAGYWDVTDVLDENGQLKMKAGIDYNTSADAETKSPVIVNPFLNQTFYDNTIFGTNAYEPRDVNEDESYTTTNWKTRNLDAYQRTLKFKMANAILVKQTIYNMLYVGSFTQEQVGTDADGDPIYQLNYDKHQYTLRNLQTGNKLKDANVYYDYNQDGKITLDEYYQYGGYQLKDKEGNFVYELSEYGNLRPKQMGLQTEDAVAQNEKYGVEEASKTIAYEVCVRFTLTSDGMEATIINDSIREGVGDDNNDEDIPTYLKHNNVISKIQLCKYATVNGNDQSTGEIVLPDGSGAVIKFNSEKSEQYASIYPEKRIYGDDMAINKTERGNVTEKMMLPMYGFIETSDRKGVVAIVSKGAAQTSISADFLRDASKGGMMKYNYAYFTTYYRDSEKVKVTSSTEYTKVSEDFYQGDVTYKYIFLSSDAPSTYVDVANVYRKYLLEKYPELVSKQDTTTVSTPTITFLGAYEKKTFKMGFVVDADYSLTTFDQASKIVAELKDNGVSNMNVSYRSWTEDGFHQETTADVDVANVIGGKKDMKEFSNYLKELGFSFFPEYKVANGIGYDFAFGSLKYSSKSISGSYSNSMEYVLSTGLENTNGKRGNFISPIYYNSLATKYLKNYEKLDVSGIYLSDLGNKTVADYSRGKQVYSATATLYQRDALDIFKQNSLVMLNAPYDYAFSYTDVATVIPVQCTLYGAVNYSIPLYQLVCSGLFDYSSKPVNYNNDYSIRWNLMKAIETGSNIAFVLSAEDTSVLLNTNITEYYNSYYTNWKENIIYMNNVLNSTGIYESYLLSHEYLTDNVVKVQYANGLTIIINYDSENYVDDVTGYSVKSNWYAIIEEGE